MGFSSNISVKNVAVLLSFSVVVLFIVMLVAAINGACDTRYAEEIISPNGEYAAQSSDSDCGATTPYVTDVQIRKISRWPLEKSTTVFFFRGRNDDVNIIWTDNNTINVTYYDCREIYQQEESWEDIKVVYDQQCDQN